MKYFVTFIKYPHVKNKIIHWLPISIWYENPRKPIEVLLRVKLVRHFICSQVISIATFISTRGKLNSFLPFYPFHFDRFAFFRRYIENCSTVFKSSSRPTMDNLLWTWDARAYFLCMCIIVKIIKSIKLEIKSCFEERLKIKLLAHFENQ